jgi:hypothetical protein
VIYRLLPHLNRAWKQAAVIAVVPMADGAANGAAGWPIYAVLNQHDVSYVWTHLAALVTLGLALFVVWMIGLAVARPAAEVGGESLFGKLASLNRPATPAAPIGARS